MRARRADQLATLRWGVAYGIPGAAYAFLPDAGRGEVLSDLGARFGSVAAGRTGIFQQLPYEELSRFADERGTDRAADVRGAGGSACGWVHALSHLLVFSYGEALRLLDQLLSTRRAAPPT